MNSLLNFYNPLVDDTCPLCGNVVETSLHLFVKCPIASHIWFGLSFQHLISTDLQELDDYFLYWFNDGHGDSPYDVNWPSIADVIMWCVWKLKCDVIFRKISIDMIKLF